MENILTELAKQIPNAVAVIVMAYLFLHFQKQAEERRVNDAKEQSKERRQHEAQINNMWAGYIKQLTENHEETFRAIAKALADHETSSQERYDKMRITQDLIEAVKKREQGNDSLQA